MDESPALHLVLKQVQKSLATTEQLVTLLIAQNNVPEAARPPLLSVKHRHFMVLLCHPAEYTYQQIAAQMGISLNTVHTHRKQLFMRFGVKSKTGLVRLGQGWGL